jgi:hypothetical protein
VGFGNGRSARGKVRRIVSLKPDHALDQLAEYLSRNYQPIWLIRLRIIAL